jgi:hypothetical protein
VLAIFQKSDDCFDVFDGQRSLSRNLRFVISATLETFDIVKEIDRPVLTPRKVLYEAHHRAVLFARDDDQGRDFGLPQRLVGFQPALSADQVISKSAGPRVW